MAMMKKSNLFKTSAAVLILAAVVAGGVLLYQRFFSPQTLATEETPLQTAEATRGDLILYANGTGTIIPAAEANFGFNTDGQVSEINVKVGDVVETGQVLAQLDNTQAMIELADRIRQSEMAAQAVADGDAE